MIYEPRGKAREYSPLAINLYSGCGHQCSYCYVPKVLKMDKQKFDHEVNVAKQFDINKLKKEAAKYAGSSKQILMSFTTDPYNPFNDTLKLTRKALEIFLDNRIPVAILTKSGLRACQDLDLIKKFGKHIKVGASLTFDNASDSKNVEAGASLPAERLAMLRTFHEHNVKTWVSFEPILDSVSVLNLMNHTLEYVDEYQFGKLAGDKREINWKNFLFTVTNVLRNANKKFYIKNTLAAEAPAGFLTEQETDQDFLTLPAFDDKFL